MYRPTESLLRRVSQQLYNLEKRDWELWTIVSVTGILVSLGILAIALPSAFLKNGSVYFDMTVSRPLAVGLVVLVALLNTYLVGRRREVRRLREEIIFNTLQKQVIEQQSFTDPLTEIYNRRSLDDIVGRFISHARRRKVPLTFLMVDVDKVKNVNTRFGHLSGDFVLAEVANLLKGSIRGCAAAGRYGGDEFVIILSRADVSRALKVADRIREILSTTVMEEPNGKSFSITVSEGVTSYGAGDDAYSLILRADNALYAAKQNGRDRIETDKTTAPRV